MNLPFQRVEPDSGGGPDPAKSRPDRLASSERVCLARFPVSRHRLGATEFFGLNFGYAAIGASQVSNITGKSLPAAVIGCSMKSGCVCALWLVSVQHF